MFNNSYKGKKVLVTGHTGFKGSWLSLWLLKLGAKVVGLSIDIPTKPSNFEACQIHSDIRDIRCDIRDFDSVKKVFEEEKPDIVFHLAAQPITRLSYELPKETVDTNVIGTLNILECLRIHSEVSAGVMITSDKCYQNVEWIWGYRENDQVGGDDPYSASKGAAEVLIHSYQTSFFNLNENGPKVCSVRAGNVIGGGDWAEDRIVPDCFRAFSNDKTVELRSPHSTRPWQHVLEPLSGYLWLGAKLLQRSVEIIGGSYNFGPRPGVDKTVEELILEISKIWQGKYKVNAPEGKLVKEANLLRLNCDKAQNDLGWEAVLDFKETIEMTTSWYHDFYSKGENMKDFTLDQISRYENLAQKRKISWGQP